MYGVRAEGGQVPIDLDFSTHGCSLFTLFLWILFSWIMFTVRTDHVSTDHAASVPNMQVCSNMPPLQGCPPTTTTNQPTNQPARPPTPAWSCASPARARPLARARLDLADRVNLDGAVSWSGGAAVVVDAEQAQLSCAGRRKARDEQLKRKARAQSRWRRKGAVRAARRTGSVRLSELVPVAQLALVLEVVDSVRARQVVEGKCSRRLRWWEGGSQWAASRRSHARRAGSVRAAVGSGRVGQAHLSWPQQKRPLLEYSEQWFRRLPR